MREDVLTSSDTSRTGRPLMHARTVRFDEPFDLEMGGQLPALTICYEVYGRLSQRADNAVLICHALSGDSHVASHDEKDDPGWWEIAVGPGKAIDTNRYFVVCPNILGGCRGTTGPNTVNPSTGKPYGKDFPTITIGDIVKAQKKLTDHLGIGKLLAVVGGSMGGQQVLRWAVDYPSAVEGAVAIATAPRITSQSLAFDIVGRNAILRDPHYHQGQYYDKTAAPDVGLAIARMIGHITYLSRESMAEKFEQSRNRPKNVSTAFEKRFSVGSYLGYQGDRFVERFDANSYIFLTMAMDLFDLGDSVPVLASRLRNTECRWLVISFSSDWLFPPDQSRTIVNALLATNKQVSYCNVTSSRGHDAFLLEQELPVYGELIRGYLDNLDGCQAPTEEPLGEPNDYAPIEPRADKSEPSDSPLSIYGPRRLDYDRILQLIPPHASVLDLGCAHGGLLYLLKQRGYDRLMGVELDQQAVISCVHRGLHVLHADLNRHLGQFTEQQFDCVVLSQTLQVIRDIEGLLAEMIRVGRRGIVSFPNFAYYKLRSMLCEQGRAPETDGLLKYKWYNTPNIRFFSITDFEELCAKKNIRVHERITLDTEEGREIARNANADADLAIFVISR